MGEDWRPISRIGQDVAEIRADDRVRLIVELSEAPPTLWARAFVASYTGFGVRSLDDDWPLPEVHGSTIVSWPREDDVKRWLLLMDERIAQANESYKSEVVPELTRQDEARKKAEQEYVERLGRIRREIEDV